MKPVFRRYFFLLIILFSGSTNLFAAGAADSLFAILSNEKIELNQRVGIARNSKFFTDFIQSEDEFKRFSSLTNKWYKSSPDNVKLYIITYCKCEWYTENNKIGEIFITADKFKQAASASKSKDDLIRCLTIYDRAYKNLGLYKEWLNTSREIYHLQKNRGTPEDRAGGLSSYCWTLNNCGFFLKDQQLLDSCIYYHKLFSQTMTKYDLPNGLFMNNYAIYILVLLRTKNYDQAMDVIHEAIRFAKKNAKDENQLKFDLASFYNSAAIAKFKLGEVDSAFYYSKLTKDLKQNVGDIFEGPIYFLSEMGKYKEAAHMLQPYIFGESKPESPHLYNFYCGFAAPIYYKAGQYKEATYCYRFNKNFSDSVRKIDNASRDEYDNIKTKLIIESERKSARLASEKIKFENQKERERKNLIIYVGLVISVIIVIFLFIFYKRYKITQKQNEIIASQKHSLQAKNEIIEEKQKEIIDSINYAKRIQYTLLAHDDLLKENLNDFFVFFKPKDIVSGDFYWATKHNNLFYLAVCDSTGHGVPGAFMSLLSIGFLNEAINEKGIVASNDVFNFVRKRLIDNLNKEGQKDGFDGILICIDKTAKRITYTAANNKPVLVHKGEMNELGCDRMPVGIGERKEDFKLFNVEYSADDMLYLYTDGYADQFGGEKGKKFKYKNLNENLLASSAKPLSQQCSTLANHFENWKGDFEQVDDVTVIGIKL